ncbi:cytochrome P450 [Streptomyces diacarni]|uniref:cytochrome P450 n=1 Tax=Streptomyces diacarni TaxID=2800381 RepID=UPI001FE8B4FB|nr:cytochrome P450 [Streptomyces diacarni]
MESAGERSGRKTALVEKGTGRCPVRHDADGVWRVATYDTGRAALRAGGTVQAGLGIETVEKLPASVRRPVLYRDGPEHREHRRQTARYFTPRRVSEHYRDLMIRVADQQLARLRQAGSAQLSDLSFALAAEVTAGVIGLTESRPGLLRRLERFFPDTFEEPSYTSLRGLRFMLLRNTAWLGLYFGDVRPAVRARRRARRDDLLSHLLDEGCTAGEILGECVTFAAAGMITTREFVNVAAWHLFGDDALREEYLTANEAGRHAVLHEILRLEPVVSALHRRTTAALDLPDGDGATVTVPAGSLVEIRVDDANLDTDAFGAAPERVCPARGADGHVPGPGLSFGDGPHKCPGAAVAIQETDIFLTRLFALPGLRTRGEPTVRVKESLGSYEVRGLVVTVDPDPDQGPDQGQAEV